MQGSIARAQSFRESILRGQPWSLLEGGGVLVYIRDYGDLTGSESIVDVLDL